MTAGLLHYRSIYASIGGGEDIGRRLSPEGRELIRRAAERNDVPLIEEETLEQSVQRRKELLAERLNNSPVKLYVNIGGGLASLGHSANGDLIPIGLNKHFPLLNYPRRGLIHEYGDQGIPVLHIQNVASIAKEYGLPLTPTPLPQPGVGSLFSEERYNLYVASAALAIVILTLIIVLLFDRKAQSLASEGVDPDTLI